MTLWQLVNGGYEFGAYCSGIPNAKQVVEAHFPRVGGHQDGSTRFYGIPGQLICLAGPEEVPSVWAATATPDDFEALSSTLRFEWDYSSSDDCFTFHATCSNVSQPKTNPSHANEN
jgi:hypothetical protein